MVKEGYKQTEIGIIPEIWDVQPLQNIAPLQRGFDLPYSKMQEGPYPVVFSNGVGAFHNRYMVKGPGVVTGRSGTIGKVHYIPVDYWPHNTSLWVTDFHGNNPRFIYYLFQTIQWDLFNSGSGVPTLNRNDVHSSKSAVPTVLEQERIAESLSDIDKLISSLDKLITKKKAIKQGAMKHLLTGKVRLPGFIKEWEIIQINQLGKMIGGGTPSTQNESYWKGSIPWISSSDLQEDDIHNVITTRFITMEAINNSATVICPKDTVLIISRVGVGKVAVAPCEICTSQDYTNIIIENYCPEFIAYVIQMVMKQKASRTQGTSIKGITTAEIGATEIIIPDKIEQEAIAKEICDLDNEIASLEKKLTKMVQIKQGMMQQLLRGKIRLV